MSLVSPPLCSSLGLRATVRRLLCSPSENCHLPLVAPSVLSKLSSLLTCGALCHRQAAQPLPSRTPSQLHLSYAWALFPLMEGRELGNHHCGTLSRHLHSDSETHFYLFTVNSYSCSQQFLGTSLSGCLVLASPLGFQDNLPRNCLSALPVLPLPSLSRNHLGLSSRTEQVQDPGFCFSPGQYSSR